VVVEPALPKNVVKNRNGVSGRKCGTVMHKNKTINLPWQMPGYDLQEKGRMPGQHQLRS